MHEMGLFRNILIINVYQADCDIRDFGKKVQQLEIGFDETNDKLIKATESLEEKEKMFKEVESDVAALSRYVLVERINLIWGIEGSSGPKHELILKSLKCKSLLYSQDYM